MKTTDEILKELDTLINAANELHIMIARKKHDVMSEELDKLYQRYDEVCAWKDALKWVLDIENL